MRKCSNDVRIAKLGLACDSAPFDKILRCECYKNKMFSSCGLQMRICAVSFKSKLYAKT